MNILIVYAHPEPKSFNGAMKDAAVDELAARGHTVVVSDLYADGFAAVAGRNDYDGPLQDPGYLRIDMEQTFAHENGTTAADIAAEQRKVAAADLLILQYPMWWFSMPAILKGWADRVFTRGFAYLPGRKYDTGMFRGKTAMVAVTTGTSEDTYAPDGIDGSLLDILWPVHNGLLRYTGFDVLEPFAVHMPRRRTAEERDAELARLRCRLASPEKVPQLFFHPAEDYGPDERLLPGVEAFSGFQHNTERLGKV